jgi:hypothetical protein
MITHDMLVRIGARALADCGLTADEQTRREAYRRAAQAEADKLRALADELEKTYV